MANVDDLKIKEGQSSTSHSARSKRLSNEVATYGLADASVSRRLAHAQPTRRSGTTRYAPELAYLFMLARELIIP